MRSTSNLNKHFSSYTSDVRSLLNEFKKSPHSNIFYKNRKGLIDSCKTVDFNNEKWNYNPMQFCQDEYKKQYYYPVILICNRIGSIYDFNHNTLNGKIKVPDINIIVSILSFEKEQYI